MKAKGRRDGGEVSREVEALGATRPFISCAGVEGGRFISRAAELHFERRAERGLWKEERPPVRPSVG